MCMLLNEEDKRVAIAIRNVLPQIAMAVDEITSRLKDGGRLFYIGAGTSGRLGILDAVECPPTYSTDPEMVQGIIAGGYNAIFKAQEGAEDSLTLAQEDLQAKNLSAKDCVVGIAASGRTPYVIGGLDFANSINALTIAISCTSNSEISSHAKIAIEALTGPEAITGSTVADAFSKKFTFSFHSLPADGSRSKKHCSCFVDIIIPKNHKAFFGCRNIGNHLICYFQTGSFNLLQKGLVQICSANHGNSRIVSNLLGFLDFHAQFL